MSKIERKDIYFLVVIVIGVVIGASALISYMHNETKVHMNTEELIVTQMEFTSLNDSTIIILHVTNSGTSTVTVAFVKINGDKITVGSIHGLTFEASHLGTITLEHDWTTGNNYTASLFTSDGSMVGSYTDTA